MSTINVYGRSDDLINIGGDFSEQLYADTGKNLLVFSNGLILSIEYSTIGDWEIAELVSTEDTRVDVFPAGDDRIDDDYPDYSDVAHISTDDEVGWVVKASDPVRLTKD